MDEGESFVSTPDEIIEFAQTVTEELLPSKSRHLYDKAYKNFMAWRVVHQTSSFSENVLLAYFHSLINKLKPSSLWVEYSKLKSTLNIYNQTDISKYAKLLAFLKRKSEGFKPKKACTFLNDELKTFIDEAPDQLYLLSKVAVIFGIMGACRRQELHCLSIENIVDAGDVFVVHIIKTKNRIDRTFTVTGKYYRICKKYLALRPNPCATPNFFIRYVGGKCLAQNIGINTFGQMGKIVANYLNLPNPDLYTGHCFRRTSATLLVDAGGDITSLKRHGGWKSTAVAEGYIENSIDSRKKVSNLLMASIENTVITQKNISSTFIPESRSVLSPMPVIEAPNNILPTFTPQTESQISQSDITPTAPENKGISTPTLSQIIKQNSDIHINTTASTSIPSITIAHNSIQNLHLHFHK